MSFHPGRWGWFSSLQDPGGAQRGQNHRNHFLSTSPSASHNQPSTVRMSCCDTGRHRSTHDHPCRHPSSNMSGAIQASQAIVVRSIPIQYSGLGSNRGEFHWWVPCRIVTFWTHCFPLIFPLSFHHLLAPLPFSPTSWPLFLTSLSLYITHY